MPHLCPWSLDTISYDGICSHVCLKEDINGSTLTLTPEEIESLDSKRKLQFSHRDKTTRGAGRLADDQRRYQVNAKATGKFFCGICSRKFGTGAFLRRHYKTRKHLDNAAGITKTLTQPERKVKAAADIANLTFYCKLCNYSAGTQGNLNQHFESKKHLAKVAESTD